MTISSVDCDCCQSNFQYRQYYQPAINSCICPIYEGPLTLYATIPGWPGSPYSLPRTSYTTVGATPGSQYQRTITGSASNPGCGGTSNYIITLQVNCNRGTTCNTSFGPFGYTSAVLRFRSTDFFLCCDQVSILTFVPDPYIVPRRPLCDQYPGGSIDSYTYDWISGCPDDDVVNWSFSFLGGVDAGTLVGTGSDHQSCAVDNITITE